MKAIEISEKIRDHLIEQNAKSLNDGGGCAYRGKDGNMCAVGCLIKDEAYNRIIEGASSRTDKVVDALKVSGYTLSPMIEAILSVWQSYHDGSWLFDVYERFSYEKFLKGSEKNSPIELHNRLVEKYNLENDN